MSDIRSSIGLTREQFMGSLQRILAFYSIPKTPDEAEQAAAYTSALFEVVSSWDAITFEDVCQRLVNRLNPMKKPMPKDFFNVRDAVYDDKRAERQECPRCHDAGMTYVRVKHLEYNEEFPACLPCQVCHKWKKNPIKHELEVLRGVEPYTVGNPGQVNNPFKDWKQSAVVKDVTPDQEPEGANA